MDRTGTVEVITTRGWFGDQRLGTFTVYLDGDRIGRLPPGGRLTFRCSAGPHVVRARQWWYLSPRLPLEVRPELPVRVAVDVPRTGSLAIRLLGLMFAPWRGLTIAVLDS